MVWYQKFEYAVGHWLQKTAEHVFGSVLCSPGCFSLFRGSALMDDNVLKRYTTTATKGAQYVQYDQGNLPFFFFFLHSYFCLWLLCAKDKCWHLCFLRGGSMVVYPAPTTGVAGRIQRCFWCVHQLTTGVQRVLQPEAAMGTFYTG